MAQSGTPAILSSVVQSVREACQRHVTYQDYISVSGFITLDIDGCNQERLVLSELIPERKAEEVTNSFSLKTLNWANLKRQTRVRPNIQRQASTNNRIELTKKKPICPGLVGKRTDVKNLTFTLNKTDTPLPRKAAELLSTATFSVTEVRHNQTENKSLARQYGLQGDKVSRTLSSHFESRRKPALVKGKPGIFPSHQRIEVSSQSFEQDKGNACQRSDNIVLSTKNTALNSSEFNRLDRRLSALSDTAFGIDSVIPDFLVDHNVEEEEEEVEKEMGHVQKSLISTGATGDSINCVAGDDNEGGSTSTVASQYKSFSSPSRTALQPVTRLLNKSRWDIQKYLNTDDDQLASVVNTGNGRDLACSQPSVSESDSPSQSQMVASSTNKTFNISPSLSSLQPIKKKKRLRNWINIFRRDTKPSVSNKTWSVTNTSLRDLSPFWPGSSTSLHQHT